MISALDNSRVRRFDSTMTDRVEKKAGSKFARRHRDLVTEDVNKALEDIKNLAWHAQIYTMSIQRMNDIEENQEGPYVKDEYLRELLHSIKQMEVKWKKCRNSFETFLSMNPKNFKP